MSCVLDASALLAWANDEAGGEAVFEYIATAEISTVNFSEVLQKAASRGVAAAGLATDLLALGLQLRPFSVRHAELAAGLWPHTQKLGLSLADRACLALGLDRNLPVITADRQWSGLDLGIAIELIR